MNVSTQEPLSTLQTILTSGTPDDDDDGYKDFFEMSQFITGMVLFPIIIIIGLSGNMLSLIVLSRKKMLTSTNVFLSALAVGDSIKLLNDALYCVCIIIREKRPDIAAQMMGYVYPVSHYVLNMAVCVTSWLTVSVAVERYISVCHPTKAKEMCTIPRARLVSVFVFLGMGLVALPSLFRYKTVLEWDSLQNKTIPTIQITDLWLNETYAEIFSWSINLVRSVIPLLVLIFFNACIIRALRRQRVKGKTISARNRITLMLVTVVILYFICVTPDAVMSTFLGFGFYDEKNLVKGIREFTDVLLAVNSGINFVVYCAWSLTFRQTFMEVFCRSYRDYREYQSKGYSIADGQTVVRNDRKHSVSHGSASHLPPATHNTKTTMTTFNAGDTEKVNGKAAEEQNLI